MYMLMSLQVTLTGECLITCTTVIWMLPTVYESMKFQITLPINPYPANVENMVSS